MESVLASLKQVGQGLKWINISPKLSLIEGCNPGPFTLNGTNTFILGTGPRRMLIDTGERLNIEYATNFKEFLASEKIQIQVREPLITQKIVITHYHHDHIGGLTSVVKFLRESQGQNSFSVYKRVLGLPVESEYEEEVKIEFKPLHDGDTIEVEGAILKVLATPGHTPDHICLYEESEGWLFTGDCIIGAPSSAFQSLEDYMRSLKRLESLEGVKVLIPSHGECTGAKPYDFVRRQNIQIKYYYKYRKDREDLILALLAEKPRTLQQLLEIVYKGEVLLGDPRYPAAKHNTKEHLKKLENEEKIEEKDGEYMKK